MTRVRKRFDTCDLLVALGLAVVTVVVFVRVAWFDFINYDDPFFVVMNENVRNGLTLEGIRWAFATPFEASWIPLTWLSYMVDIQLFGVNPGGHHLINVLLHTASTVLLFLFLSIATGERWKSCMVAFLFALHPLHVESVAWVAERKDVLSGLFWMLTLCAYVHYARTAGFLGYAVCLASFALGLLAKPMLVTLPLVLLLVDVWPLRRLDRAEGGMDVSRLPRLLVEKVPYVLLTVAVSIITYSINSAGGVISGNYTVMSRAGKALTNYVAYLGKMVWPAGLAVFYPSSLYPPSTLKIMVSLIFLLVISIAVCIARGPRRYLLVGWMWYLITLVPVSGLIQVGGHSIADRYTYIPLVGIFIMFVWGVPDILGNWSLKEPVLRGASLVLGVILVIVTSLQLGHWENSITLFSHAAAVTERNYVAYNNLGYALLEVGRVEEAIANFKRAVEVRSPDTFALVNLGDAYRRIGQYEKALEACSRAILFDPRNEKAHHTMGLIYLDSGRSDLAFEKYQLLNNAGSSLAPILMKEIMIRGGGTQNRQGKP